MLKSKLKTLIPVLIWVNLIVVAFYVYRFIHYYKATGADVLEKLPESFIVVDLATDIAFIVLWICTINLLLNIYKIVYESAMYAVAYDTAKLSHKFLIGYMMYTVAECISINSMVKVNFFSIFIFVLYVGFISIVADSVPTEKLSFNTPYLAPGNIFKQTSNSAALTLLLAITTIICIIYSMNIEVKNDPNVYYIFKVFCAKIVVFFITTVALKVTYNIFNTFTKNAKKYD